MTWKHIQVCVVDQLLWEKKLQVIFLTENKGDNTSKDLVPRGWCSFKTKICWKQMRRQECSVHFVFFLEGKKQKMKIKHSPYTFWQVPQGLEMKGTMQVQSFIVIYIVIIAIIIISSYVVSRVYAHFRDVSLWKNIGLLLRALSEPQNTGKYSLLLFYRLLFHSFLNFSKAASSFYT